jgi:hypothetical protein
MTAADITQHAAKAFLNDAAQALWTDAILLPYLSQAVLELSNQYRINEIPLELRVGVTISVEIGDTELDELPTDMIEPISMKERTLASTDDWSDDIDEVDDVDPSEDTSQTINQWAWRNNKIYINPPTTDREVRLLYTGSLTAITSTGSTIDDSSSKAYLAARTAQLAIANGGNNPSKAGELEETVVMNLDILLGALVKNNQNAGSARRRGYKGRHR